MLAWSTAYISRFQRLKTLARLVIARVCGCITTPQCHLELSKGWDWSKYDNTRGTNRQCGRQLRGLEYIGSIISTLSCLTPSTDAISTIQLLYLFNRDNIRDNLRKYMKMKNPPVSDVAAPTDSHSKTLCSFCTKAVGKAFLEWDIDHYDLSEKSFTIPPTYLQRNSTLECPFCQLMKIFLEKIDGGLLQVANHVKLSMELSSLDGESPFDLGGQEYSDVYIRHIPTSTTKVYTLISQSGR